MAHLIMWIIDEYRDVIDNKSDQRVKDWPMMSGPLPTSLICVLFVYIVKYLGPKLMEKREPFQIQNILIVYNFLHVILNAWLFLEGGSISWFSTYSWRCQPVDFSNNPQTLRLNELAWWYYMLKLIDLLDTIFFVLRKKFNHISKLHVTHHVLMPMSTWVGIKFVPNGHGTFFGLVNTFVHVIMYTYYMFSAMGQRFQKYLWWKKYLTILQIVQFLLIFLHAFQLLFINCDYPLIYVILIGLHAILFTYLFVEFYITTYRRKNKEVLMKKTDNLLLDGYDKTGLILGPQKIASETSVFTKLTNVCQMDHDLLYEHGPVSTGQNVSKTPLRRRDVTN